MVIYAADDERFMLDALTDSICEVLPDAKVRGFRKAQDLLDAFSVEACDILFLDIRMPVMDGVSLAKRVISMKNDTNIIFVTGYDNYKSVAMDIYASAYIMKPVTPEKVREAMSHLRYHVNENKLRCKAITFGNFSLYVDGSLVTFHRKSSAELLAYLVVKGGTVVSRSELTLVLFEDETHSAQSRKKLDNAIRTLQEDLARVNAEYIFYRGSDGLAINRELLDSDFFEYQDGNKQLYHGQFLEQYSWSEYFKEIF